MTTPITPRREITSIAAAASGVVALVGFLSFWAVIPEKVNRLEVADRDKQVKIEALQQDSTQRRELLAGALATLAQINDRTKRIEDIIVQKNK